VTGRTRTLGVVCSDTRLYGPASTLVSVELAARDVGYFVQLETLRRLDSTSITDSVGRLRDRQVEGIVVMAPTDETARALESMGSEFVDTPMVAVQGPTSSSVPCVAIDQYAGAAEVVAHLLALGHETVWHIAGPDDWLEAQARRRGWRETLVDAGCRVPPVAAGDWSARSGYRVARAIIEQHSVTAMFVGNDQMALGALWALHESGRRVPEDVSLVGFDDIPEAAYFTPPLTTVRQPFDEVGRRAHELLLEQIVDEAAGVRTAMASPELRARASTAPPPP
jgi:DNA-binding LacI/PurR family transcriptional regulator